MLLSRAVEGRAAMAQYLKCQACRVRVRPSGGAVTGACPLCAGPLEPVRELNEIVGFRAAEPLSTAAEAGGGHRRLAEEVAKVIARRRAAEARSWSEADRWAP